MATTRNTRHLAIPFALAIGFAALTGCTSSGSDKPDGPTTTAAETTTTAETDETTTTAEVDETTTTEASGDSAWSADDLDSVMLTATDLGAGWTQDGPITGPDADDESTNEMLIAMEEQCPDAAGFASSRSAGTREVSFTHDEDYDAAIAIDPDPGDRYDPDRVDGIIAALKDCTLEMTYAGNDYEFTFDAARTANFGDISIEMIVYTEVDTGTETGAWSTYTLAFLEGDISASIELVDGIIDGETLTADTDLLLQWADVLEGRIADLQR